MKIAIISINMYAKNLNFACPLHTYAFQQFLLKNGIECTVLNYKPVYYDNFDLRHPYDYYDKKCKSYAKRIPASEEDRIAIEEKLKEFTENRDAYQLLYKQREIRHDKFQNFIEKNYIKTDVCYDSDLLEVIDPGFDCYICATDVIWKNHLYVGFDRGFFLASKAMENKWKIAYSASCGVTFSNGKEDEDLFLHYVNDIDFVSVREARLKKYIEEHSTIQASLVLDPVLLHDKSFYESFLVKPPEEHYVLLYYVMEKATDTILQAVNYARAHNLKIVEISDLPLQESRLKPYTDIEHVLLYDIGVEQWLGYIRYADCIFTNSFHCSCFSIIFEKKFFVGFRCGDKLPHLMESFDLSSRQLDASTDLVLEEPKDIDYSKVRKILEKKRAESAEFIFSAIQYAASHTKPETDYSSYKKALVYPIKYHSGKKGSKASWSYDEDAGKIAHLSSGAYEYTPNSSHCTNDGTCHLMKNKFSIKYFHFTGWNIRIKIDTHWFWYLEDGTLIPKGDYNKKIHLPIRLFQNNEAIPYIPVNHIHTIVAEAVWKEGAILKAKRLIKKVLSHFWRIQL